MLTWGGEEGILLIGTLCVERWQPKALLDSNPVSLFGLLVPLFTKGPSQCSSDGKLSIWKFLPFGG